MDELQINDIKWKKLSENKFIPILKFWKNNFKEFNSIPLENYKFNLKLSEAKYCTGYYLDGKYNECKFHNKINNLVTVCSYCERLQGFKSSFIFGDLTHERSDQILSQEYYIYLAYFEPGIIKVGTANIQRQDLRLIEQDALVFTYIAKGTGYQIQKLEHLISKKINITETIKSSHKFKFLSSKPNLENAKERFESTFDRIKNEFKDSEYKDVFFEKIEIKSFLENNIYFPQKYKKFEDLNLFGNFKGLRGRYLLIENSEIAAFDINYLIGRNIASYIDSYNYNFEESQLSLI